MTGKERAALKSLAMTMDPVAWIGKGSLSPEVTAAIDEALQARELIKVSVLQNCADDAHVLAETVAERTGSQVVQVIGKKIVLYRVNPEKHKKTAEKPKTTGKLKTAGKPNTAGKTKTAGRPKTAGVRKRKQTDHGNKR